MFKLSSLCLASLIVLQAPFSVAQSAPVAASVAEQPLAERINAALAAHFKADEPGATVIVVKDGKTVFRKAYGSADLTSKQAMQPEMQMRLGSITKQFTSTAILMLAEQGKLSLQDDITRFLPDYPTGGKRITIEHLLTHTSGILSYTSMPSFRNIMDKDLSVAEMIATFKNEPKQFEPGTRWDYSNSGYFLLGAIIEKVSGKSYADFVAENIFTPLGMRDTAYEGHERNGIRHIAGYSRSDKGGFEPTIKISMNLPYAAGSLVSTVDDLARWDAAISSGKLLKPASWQKAFTAYTTTDGKSTHYGYGWEVSKFQGYDTIGHGGGIPGFATYAIRIPSEHLYVAVLTNADSGLFRPESAASLAAGIMVGKPFIDYKPVALDAKVLDRYVGTYKVDDQSNRVVTRDGDHLVLQRTGRPPVSLQAYSENGFFTENGFVHMEFVRDAKGEVTHMMMSQFGNDERNDRTSGTVPVRPSVTLDAKTFDTYVGRYQLNPQFFIELTREGEKFFAQATGQGKLEIVAEAANRFYVKAVGAVLTIEKGADGAVTQLVLSQGGRDAPAKKIN